MSDTIEIKVNGINWPSLHAPFIEIPIENATDIITLDGTMYTDFINERRQWKLHWSVLESNQYNIIKTAYRSQFLNESYLTVDIPFYGINGVLMRMFLNEKNIRNAGDCILGVEVILTEKRAIN